MALLCTICGVIIPDISQRTGINRCKGYISQGVNLCHPSTTFTPPKINSDFTDKPKSLGVNDKLPTLMTEDKRIDKVLDTHLNEIKAGHDGKLKSEISNLIIEAQIRELKNFRNDDGSYYLMVNGNNITDRIATLQSQRHTKESKKG